MTTKLPQFIPRNPFPPFIEPSLSLWLVTVLSTRPFHVSEAESRAEAEYLRLRSRAHGEGHWLSRIRRALAVRQRDQFDGHPGARHGARHLDRRDGREAGDRHRARFSLVLGLDQIRADLGPAGFGLQGARHRPCGNAYGLFRAV